MVTSDPAGTCDARFAAVRDAFRENLASREEHGAAVAVWLDGRLVVDLWGGACDRAGTRAWSGDTLVCMMSVVKAVTALLVHVLVDRGALDLDRPVAHWWPAFAAHGKQDVLVRHVLDHRAGLPAVATDVPPEALYDWEAMLRALEQTPLHWPAGTVPAYHPVTMGFIAGELIRRASGLLPGELLRELLDALGAPDYYIGVPAAEDARCAELFGHYAGTIFGATDPSTLAYTSIAQIRTASFNTAAFRRAQIPSINGHGTPRAVATLFGHLAWCRAGRSRVPISPAAIERATVEQWHAVEQTSLQTRRMALGFLLGGPGLAPLPASSRAFGHGGAGGALAFSDPDLALGFAYGTSHLHGQKGPSPRTVALVEATMQAAAG